MILLINSWLKISLFLYLLILLLSWIIFYNFKEMNKIIWYQKLWKCQAEKISKLTLSNIFIMLQHSMTTCNTCFWTTQYPLWIHKTHTQISRKNCSFFMKNTYFLKSCVTIFIFLVRKYIFLSKTGENIYIQGGPKSLWCDLEEKCLKKL